MKKRVLFLCTGNSCRSQMAEGLLKHIAGDKYDVFSAGINPTDVNPKAIDVMQEIGINISKQRSKSVNLYKDDCFDYVITVCDNAKENCPYFPGSKMIHWNIKDPATAENNSEQLNIFRNVRDEIKQQAENLLNQST